MTTSAWSDFWKHQRDSFTNIMQINTSYFATQLEKKFGINERTRLLDYGCGPALLLDGLEHTGLDFTGADINTFYLDQCRKKYPRTVFVQISPDPEANHKLLKSELGDKGPDIIVMLSILQYFKDHQSIQAVLLMARNLMAKDGKIVIADIVDDDNSPIRDTWSLLMHSLRRGKVIALVRFILYLMFSSYRKLSGSNRLTTLNDRDIRRIGEHLKLQVARVDGLTIHASRKNYVLTLL